MQRSPYQGLTLQDILLVFAASALFTITVAVSTHSLSSLRVRADGAAHHTNQRGFTLIELSIVLVIIGLIVGGVLAGQNLIAAAAVRAQVTQIEKFNQAKNTFLGKYGALPGDIKQQDVTAFGFTVAPTRSGGQGGGDGNNLLEGSFSGGIYPGGQISEPLWFWEDLSANAKMIDGNFSTYVSGSIGSAADPTPYYPQAKLNKYMSVYVYSNNSVNWYGLSGNAGFNNSTLYSSPIATVAQAYAIDQKIDDGMPTTGNVVAQYVNTGSPLVQLPANAATDSSTTCYNTTTGAYSVTVNNGTGVNCALSFRFQ